ncbi:lantibiotic immunity ABC transporter MutE/EpiE family permease subunit [Allofustis seminis]|uniref:lantibiotic immunity ABC transporter MutE/EpiE family permease subunit n=1 Tax=Allofustis seminis TaxID=166939 RepID=UPI0003735CCE|nr:lantibiotic immunity ABC transporter MutE/EpiE family permease subunit [Allofustis seminis]
MKNYILAECIKYKHTFLNKLLMIAPLVAVVQALILMPLYFTVNAYNWWYVVSLPAMFALISAMMHRKEERKLNYRAIFSLDVNLKKIWIAKILTALVYVSITSLLHMIGVYGIQFLIDKQLIPNYGLMTLLMASALLILSNIWQIPLCLFLAKKLGFVISVGVNAILGTALGILFSTSSLWILCPYSWGIRLMLPIMHILPNGLPAEASDPLISNTSLLLPCALSIILFTLLTVITTNWFSKLEVK